MILIGQFDSPFVRRVAIAMRLCGHAFEHRPWSVFGDGEKIARFNPLMRVPTLVLDDGDTLIESHCILDHLDSLVPAERSELGSWRNRLYRAMAGAALSPVRFYHLPTNRVVELGTQIAI